MSKLSLIAKLTINEGANAEFEAALADLIAASATEDGLEVYAANADTGDAQTYWFYEIYTDDQALAVHGKGDEMKAAMGALGPFMAARPEIMMCRPVVAKGVEL